MSIVSGKNFALITLVALSTIIFLSILRARKSDKLIQIRRIAGLEALEEIVGRATETGRPIHFTTGISAIEGGDTAARVLGGLELLSYVTRKAAKYNAKMLVTVCKPSTYAVTREVVRNTYVQEGNSDAFQESTVRFLSDDQFAYATSTASLMHSEKVAGNIMVGGFGGESILLAETANDVGAIQVAGDTNVNQTPFFVVACDYTLLGEEMFAAGASLGNNRDVLGTIRAQDYGKIIAIALIILGALLKTAGNPVLADLIKW